MQESNKVPFVSVVIPVYNESKHIENCVGSVLKQDYPAEQMEILLVDGMSNDGTPDIIERLCQEDSRIHFLQNPKRIVPSALNIAIKASRGEIIVRMDCHCIYPPIYVSTLVGKLVELNAANVGGVWLTEPANDSSICHAIALCSSHPFGTGPSLHKIGCDEVTETDTVPFGCFRKDIFDKIGLFDEEMLRNEDEELNGRITRQGGRIFIVPQVEMHYMSRDSLGKMIKMYYHYGLWKPLVNKKVGNAVTYRQFIPPLFVLGCVLGLLLGLFFKPILAIWAFVMLFYFIVVFVIGIKEAMKRHRPALCLLMPVTFLCMHFAYGIGYLKGIVGLVFKDSLTYHYDR